ncbi:transcriptional repressor general negative regulator of transcription subunit 4 [Tilletia horrida]|nr:transcriptional repressor general negative regulator of transcription subunit 4 [Tilletia horrida]
MTKRTSAPHSPAVGPGGNPFPPLGMAIAAHQAQAQAAAQAAAAAAAAAGTAGGGGAGAAAAGAPDRVKTPTRDGLPPAPIKFDASQAQACRLQDAYWSEEEEDMDCPLCLEEIDLSDANFKPCPCGYQICRFCWHHIKQNLNGRCPACRRKYSDQTIEFKPMTPEEIKRLTQAKKQKERERKELEQMNRKHLANMRVVQKNLVYVVGLNSKLAKEELIPTLRSSEYFGQYGRISKILISKRTSPSKLIMGTQDTSIGVYVTYVRKEDAARAIVAIDGTKGSDGKIIRASYGTTKYCTTYLRNLQCNNPACTYLHEPGEEADSFTKEDLSTLRHAAKDTEHRAKPVSHGLAFAPQRTISTSTGTNQAGDPAAVAAAAAAAASAVAAANASALSNAVDTGPALPKTATWASGKPLTPTGPIAPLPGSSDMPPLAASVIARKASAQKIKTGSQSSKDVSAGAHVGSPGKAQLAGQQKSGPIPVPGAAGRAAAAGQSTPYSSSPLASSSPISQRASAAQDSAASATQAKASAKSAAAAAAAASAQDNSAASSPVTSKAALSKASASARAAESASAAGTPTSTEPPPGLALSQSTNRASPPASATSASTPAPAATPTTTGPPPGLAAGPPPGLGPVPATPVAASAKVASASADASSGAATPLANPTTVSDAHLSGDATPLAHSQVLSPKSSYRPSSRAQALLDDLRQRRALELDTHNYSPKPSPFPDFIEATIESWSSGGEFCFVMHGQAGEDAVGEDSVQQQQEVKSGEKEDGSGDTGGGVVPNGMTRGTASSGAGGEANAHETPFGGTAAAGGFHPFAHPAPALPPGLAKFGASGTPPPPGIGLPPGMFGGVGVGMGMLPPHQLHHHHQLPHQILPMHPAQHALAGGAPNRSGTASPAISGYSGSFDPFASSTTTTSRSGTEIEYGPGSSVTTLSSGEAAPAAPFAAIDEMRRTLSDEQRDKERNGDGQVSGGAATAGGAQHGHDDAGLDGEDGNDADKRASRFGFAAEKRKESVSASLLGMLGGAGGAGVGSGVGVGTPSGPSSSSPFFKSRLELLGLDGLHHQHPQHLNQHPHLLHQQQQQQQQQLHLQQHQHQHQHDHLAGFGGSHSHSLPQGATAQDLLGFSAKDVTGLLGHVFDADGHGASPTGANSALGGLAQQQQQQQQQRQHQHLNGSAYGGGAGDVRGAGAGPLSHFHPYGGGGNAPAGLASTPPPGFGPRVQQQQLQQQQHSQHQQQHSLGSGGGGGGGNGAHGHLNGSASSAASASAGGNAGANTSSSNAWLTKFAQQQQAAANQAQGYSALDHQQGGHSMQQQQHQHQHQHLHQHQHQHQQQPSLQHQQQQHHQHQMHAAHSPLHQHSHLQHNHGGHPHGAQQQQQQQPGGGGGFLSHGSMHYGNQPQPGGGNGQGGSGGGGAFGTPHSAPRQLGGNGGGYGHVPSLSSPGGMPAPPSQQQQQQQQRPMGGNGAGSNAEPLLAQLMAGVSVGQQGQARRAAAQAAAAAAAAQAGRYDMYGLGSGGDMSGAGAGADLSFMDPAIMSLTRNRNQQQQDGASSLKAAGASPFSPFG